MLQSRARKAVTIETVLDSALQHLFTALDSTGDPGFRFDTVVTAATRAWLLLSGIGDAEATVHSAGSDQRRANRICLCRSFVHHVGVFGRLIRAPQF
jgi:hypothetical protein